MRRSASEIIRNLERRIARLEKSAFVNSDQEFKKEFTIIKKRVHEEWNRAGQEDIEKALQKKYRNKYLQVRLDYVPTLLEHLTPGLLRDFIIEVAVFDRKTKEELAVKVQFAHLELPETMEFRSGLYPKKVNKFEKNRRYRDPNYSSGRRVDPRYVPPTEADIARNIDNVDFGPEY